MSKGWIAVAGLAMALGAPGLAGAEIFKCKGPDGKTVISDVRCEGDAPKPAAKAPEKDPSGRYQLTDADKERVKVLEKIVDSKTANGEQKSAAQWELGNIRRGAEVLMKAEEREKREALVAQLASADQKKRTELIGQIRRFYDR